MEIVKGLTYNFEDDALLINPGYMDIFDSSMRKIFSSYPDEMINILIAQAPISRNLANKVSGYLRDYPTKFERALWMSVYPNAMPGPIVVFTDILYSPTDHLIGTFLEFMDAWMQDEKDSDGEIDSNKYPMRYIYIVTSAISESTLKFIHAFNRYFYFYVQIMIDEDVVIFNDEIADVEQYCLKLLNVTMFPRFYHNDDYYKNLERTLYEEIKDVIKEETDEYFDYLDAVDDLTLIIGTLYDMEVGDKIRLINTNTDTGPPIFAADYELIHGEDGKFDFRIINSTLPELNGTMVTILEPELDHVRGYLLTDDMEKLKEKILLYRILSPVDVGDEMEGEFIVYNNIRKIFLEQ